jgi:hypothetical protein
MVIATIGITALLGALVGDHAYIGGVLRLENLPGNPKIFRVILYSGRPEDRQLDPTKLRIVYTQPKEWDPFNRDLVFGELRNLRMAREIVMVRYSRKDGLDMVTTVKYTYRMQWSIFLPPKWAPGGEVR